MQTTESIHSSAVGALVFGLFLVATGPEQARSEDPEKKPAATKREPIYHEKMDAKSQVAAAVKRAKHDNKRVLVVFGGNWCGWCYKLHDVFAKNGEIVPILRNDYEQVLVDVGSNAELLESYGKDNNKQGVPFLTVLDGDGRVLTNQNTADLEKGPEHDVAKVKAFLTKWIPEPLDAEKALAAGRARAKAEGKLVFLHIGAPTCGWCRVLEKFLAEKEAVLGRDFVDVKIDTERMTGGDSVAKKLRKGKEGGIPWFAIYDPDGKELINSDGPQGNIGYPARPHEIAHFVEMLQKSARHITPDELSQIKGDLERYAAQRNLR